jgi:hypothetical protein
VLLPLLLQLGLPLLPLLMDLEQWRMVSKNCTVSVGQRKFLLVALAYLDFKTISLGFFF